jgi:hypothetical protein
MFQNELGYSFKKKETKKRKKRGQMSHSEIKRDLAAQVLLKVFKFLREV